MNLLAKLQITNVYRLMIISLLINFLFSFQQYGLLQTLPILALTVFTTFFLDLLILYVKYRRFVFSDSAIISGLFISLILAPGQNFLIYIAASLIAILSKYLISYKERHPFNPAIFGIFTMSFVFGANLSWWGASSIIAVLVMGLLVNYQFRRFNQSLTFLASYAVLIFIASLGNSLITISELFSPVLYFFAFFMFIEPRTSPQSKNNRTLYGMIGGLIVFLSVLFLPQFNFVLGLLVSNVFAKLLDRFKK